MPRLTGGAKRYCREMTSCAEARFYLEGRGLTQLDGDGDGVPCEAIRREQLICRRRSVDTDR